MRFKLTKLLRKVRDKRERKKKERKKGRNKERK